ncbi:MAG TPA: leucyl aminopeptidase [Chloroflexota bacterium]|nr:leucyl aminopeptidase [Chloroflexota bacterium]
MNVEVTGQPASAVDADVLVVPIFEKESIGGVLTAIDQALGGLIQRAVDAREITGKLHELTPILGATGVSARRVLVLGAGEREKFSSRRMRTIAGVGARAASRRRAESVALLLPEQIDADEEAQAAVEGFTHALFDPGQYKTTREEDRRDITHLVVASAEATVAQARAAAERGRIVAEATNTIRRLANEPGNILTPLEFARAAREAAEPLGLVVEVLDQDKLAELGMGAILGVARGSDQPPCLIVIRYQSGRAGGPTLGLVGKGVTFDTGGISIKPAERMQEMKFDMCGAAATLGAMLAIGQIKPMIDVIAVMPMVENMPSARAMRPGDVLRTLNGKTIEVVNTDAEGRLILADALTYAQQLGATHLVDLATLTGACIVALGNDVVGVMGRSDDWVKQVLAAADRAGERMWQLPLDEEYFDQIKSDIADMKNSGGRGGGAITGAKLLEQFVEEAVPWVHLDIAGPASTERDRPYQSKGPTGIGVRTLVELTRELASDFTGD